MSEDFKLPLIPLGTRILIKTNEVSEKYEGTIIIPDNAKDIPTVGRIVAIGPGITSEYGIAIGDYILHSRYAGSRYNYTEGGSRKAKRNFLLLDVSEVLAKFDTSSEDEVKNLDVVVS